MGGILHIGILGCCWALLGFVRICQDFRDLQALNTSGGVPVTMFTKISSKENDMSHAMRLIHDVKMSLTALHVPVCTFYVFKSPEDGNAKLAMQQKEEFQKKII